MLEEDSLMAKIEIKNIKMCEMPSFFKVIHFNAFKKASNIENVQKKVVALQER